MGLCMRTTVDIPDALMARVKKRLSKRGQTFRSLVVTALEDSLKENPAPFRLRDAAFGEAGTVAVSTAEINRVVDEQREPRFDR